MDMFIITLSIIMTSRFLYTSCCPINLNHLYSHFKSTNTIRVLILDCKNGNNELADWLIVNFLTNLNITITTKRNKVVERRQNNHQAFVPPKFGTIELNEIVINNLRTDSVNGHVIIARDEEVFENFLKKNSLLVVPTAREYYSLVLRKIRSVKVLATLWSKYQVSNVIMQACSTGGTYVYLPFKNSSLVVSNYLLGNNLVNFGNYSMKVSMQTRPPTAILNFPKLLKLNPIYLDLQDFAGLDGSLLNELTKSLKLKYETFGFKEETVDFGMVLPNGTITGTLAQTVKKQVQLSTNGRFLMDYGSDEFEFTVPYSSDQICAVVPKAQKVPKLLLLLKCFNLLTWLTIGIIFIACTILWYLMGTTGSAWWQIYSILHGIPIRISPKTNQFPFLMCCLGFNIIIVSLVQGTFFRVFSTSTYYKDIDTLKELDASGLPIASTSFSFAADKSKLMANLQMKKAQLNDPNLLDVVAYNRNIIRLERKRDILWELKTDYLDDNGESLLHVVNECFTSLFIGFIVPKDSVFLPTFNNIIQKVFESGLTTKWYQDVEFSIFLEKMAEMKKKRISSSFSLKQIQAVFYLLILGLGIAVGAFIIELVVYIRF